MSPFDTYTTPELPPRRAWGKYILFIVALAVAIGGVTVALWYTRFRSASPPVVVIENGTGYTVLDRRAPTPEEIEKHGLVPGIDIEIRKTSYDTITVLVPTPSAPPPPDRFEVSPGTERPLQ